MSLTKEDLQAIGQMMDSKLEPINTRLDGIDKRLDIMQEDITAMQEDITAMQEDITAMQEDIEQIKENTTVTRDVVNGVGAWTEIASDVLCIPYPVPIIEE